MNGAGKGDKRRPCLVSRAEYELRYDLHTGMIDRRHFNRELRKLKIKEAKKNVQKL